MRVVLKPDLISLIVENETDAAAARAFMAEAKDHVFCLNGLGDGSRFVALPGLGPRAEACRVPIDIFPWPFENGWPLVGDAALTPFELHGKRYASVAGFWHGLKFPAEADRDRLASLHGAEVQRAGRTAPRRQRLTYRGTTMRVASQEHWALMRDACFAKFTQRSGQDRTPVHRQPSAGQYSRARQEIRWLGD